MIEINFNPFPGLTTKRLVLRQLTLADENEIFSIRSDASMAEYLDRKLCVSKEQAREFIKKINKAITKNELIYWAVTEKNNPKLIGTVCLWQISPEDCKAEIGFELLPIHQGKGIMTEAVEAVINYGFNVIGLDKIEGEVDPNNAKSIKLMEKHGFIYNREIVNTVVYSLRKN